jgi:hypothetical protein
MIYLMAIPDEYSDQEVTPWGGMKEMKLLIDKKVMK